VSRCIVVDGYAGDASVAPEVFLREQEQALGRLKGYDWYEDAVAAWESLEAVGDRTSAQWEEEFQACWPLYFAYPESPSARSHIARLRRDCRVNVEVMKVWEQSPLNELDLRSLLSKISCPSLILVGEHDFICGPAWAEVVASSIPGAELVTCRDCGHLPQYEDPERFTEIVTRWCQSHRGHRPRQP
jgi:pimeloyl-ACP methyl ester carboxylesterase